MNDCEAYSSFIVICVLGVWTVIFGIFSANPPNNPDKSNCFSYELNNNWYVTDDRTQVPSDALKLVDVGGQIASWFSIGCYIQTLLGLCLLFKIVNAAFIFNAKVNYVLGITRWVLAIGLWAVWYAWGYTIAFDHGGLLCTGKSALLRKDGIVLMWFYAFTVSLISVLAIGGTFWYFCYEKKKIKI